MEEDEKAPVRFRYLRNPLTRFINRTLFRSIRLLRSEGPRALGARLAAKAHTRLVEYKPIMLVSNDDAALVDWTNPPPRLTNPVTVTGEKLRIAWIMSPPGRESGGHQNLFRFIDFAEKAGHICSIYYYNVHGDPVSIPDIRAMIQQTDAFPNVTASMHIYDRRRGVASDVQAIFATGWETAYPVYLDQSAARRFYFVQDFEPSFYALGSEAIMAENTYRFGFHGITAGKWLAHELATKYGMRTDSFDFAVDKSRYHVTNHEPRNEVFFYARPVTPRRAFEFGLIALTDFAKLRPDITINLAGWNVSNWDVPFRYKNLASLDISELNSVYNRCAAGLVLSLTNMSLLPLELISSGVAPVVNDGPNNRMVSDNPFIEYVAMSPMAIARRMTEVLERPDAVQRSVAMSASVAEVDWRTSGEQFLTALTKAMRG